MRPSKKRNSFGLQPIDAKISHLLKPLFKDSKKQFVVINNLVKNWSEIIGKKYSKFCYPKSVTFSKKDQKGKLTIAVYNSAVGFFLESNSQLIIERIATFYGFKSISKIIIKQEPQDLKINQNSEIKLSKTKEDFLQEKLENLQDKDLQQSLKKLGREIFS